MLARRYLPSIPSLLALEAVDRLGTASAAAAELNLTQGAVSRQLQVLEGQLGVALFVRDRHRLRLTPAAQDFVTEARAALHRLDQAALALRANPSGGSLNLAILPAFGMHWLAPRLAKFAGLHPEVTVNLSTRLKPFDFTDSRFDAAIHYGRQDWAGVDYLKLTEEEILAVAAPALAPISAAKPQNRPFSVDSLMRARPKFIARMIPSGDNIATQPIIVGRPISLKNTANSDGVEYTSKATMPVSSTPDAI